MSERTVTVRLRAITDQFDKAMAGASRSVKGVSAEVKASSASQEQAFQDVGRTATIAGALVVGGLGLAAKASMGFEKQLSSLRAATGANAATMKQLQQAALQTGKDTVFSASEAAQAEIELAKAGVSVADVLGGALTGAVSLAAAGQLELGEAAEISAGAMAQFSLKGSDVGHIADLLAAGAGKAQGSVGDMGMALKQAGLVASQTGLTIEETTGGLALFAQNSLLGSDAGTSFKSMLQRLTPQSAEAQRAMDELGIAAYDSQGQFIGLSEFAGNLQSSLSGLTDEQRNAAMATIFGSDAVRAAAILYKSGEAGVRDWIAAVDDTGYASEYAATATDNLAGDLEQLGGSIETALISSGSKANGTLRFLVQTTEGAVDVFNALPGLLQGVAVGFVAVAGGATLLAGAALLTIPRVASLERNLVGLGMSQAGAAKTMTRLGTAAKVAAGAGGVLALAIAADALTTAMADTAPGVQALTASLIDFDRTGEVSGELMDIAEAVEMVKVATSNRVNPLNGFWNDKTDAEIKSARAEIEAYDQALTGLINSGNAEAAEQYFEQLQNALALRGIDINEVLPGVAEALAAVSAEGGAAAAAVEEAGGASGRLAEQAAAAAEALQGQADALRAQYDPIFAMQQAIRGHAEAQAALTAAVSEHGSSSQQAADAQFALLESTVGLDGAAKGLAAAMAEGRVSAGQAGEQLHQWVQQGLLTQEQADLAAASMGALRDRADELANVDVAVPVSAPGAEPAIAQVSRLERAIRTTGDARAIPEVDANVDLARAKLFGIDAAIAETDSRRADPTVTANTGSARSGLSAVQQLMASLDGRIATVTTRYRAVYESETRRDAARAVNGPIGRASGGILPGPPSAVDNMLIAAATGEFVVNAAQTSKHLALLELINSGRLPGFADGGVVGGSAGGPALSTAVGGLHGAVGGMTDPASIRAAVEAWQRLLDVQEQSARRAELVTTLEEARAAAATASAEDQVGAQERLHDAIRAVQDFDLDRAHDNERRAVDRLVESLEQEAKAREDDYRRRVEINNNLFELGRISTADHLGNLDRRMAREREFTDEWMALVKQRVQVVEDLARAQEQSLDAMNRLLDQQAAIQGRLATSSTRHAEQQADVAARLATAEAEMYTRRSAAAREYAAEQDRILAGRRDALASWARLDELSPTAWGNTLEQLLDNARSQMGQFTEWMDALASARARGVSEAVIASLGLDDGPEALGALRQFGAATQAEIDALNAAVAQRTTVAAEQTRREQVGGYGELAAELARSHADYLDELAGIQADYQEAQEQAQEDLSDLQAEFLAEQAELAAELAAVGAEQGRSLGAALAEGMLSKVAAVRAAAQALAAAAAGADAAKAATGTTSSLNGQVAAIRQRLGLAADAGSDSIWVDRISNGQATLADAEARMLAKLRTGTFDTGGLLQPGYTLAFNGTGAPERVVGPGQAAAPVSLTVQILAPVYGVDQLDQVVRTGVTAVLAEHRTTVAVGGTRG